MDAKYDALFTPWKIGNVEIKNRIVMCPMGGTSLFGWFELTGCGFDKEAAKLFLERAQNNVGLIIPGIAPLRVKFFQKKSSPFCLSMRSSVVRSRITQHNTASLPVYIAALSRSLPLTMRMTEVLTSTSWKKSHWNQTCNGIRITTPILKSEMKFTEK